MALFWQLSGAEGHLRRLWKDGKDVGDIEVVEDFFNALSRKHEDGNTGLELVLGTEVSGATHLLIPHSWRAYCKHLNWKKIDPYPSSQYAALSPIWIDTPLKLQRLLEDRLNISKATKVKRGDTSKANARFWSSLPNRSRAAFEQNRCLWRIVRKQIQPQKYGLPDASWHNQVVILSLALNFWIPDGVQLSERLIDASLSKFTIPTHLDDKPISIQTWYFKVKENRGLQNNPQFQNLVTPEAWEGMTVAQSEVGPLIEKIMRSSRLESPCILLVQDYTTLKRCLEILDMEHKTWVRGIEDLLSFQDLNWPSEPTRPHSPPAPDLRQPRASIYVIDIVPLYRAIMETGLPSHQLRPTFIFNALTGQRETDPWCAGHDSTYILNAWKTMAQGPTIIEQKALFEAQKESVPLRQSTPDTGDIDLPEALGLFEPKQNAYTDKFNEPNSDGD